MKDQIIGIINKELIRHRKYFQNGCVSVPSWTRNDTSTRVEFGYLIITIEDRTITLKVYGGNCDIQKGLSILIRRLAKKIPSHPISESKTTLEFSYFGFHPPF